MRKMLDVEVGAESGIYIELTLPATPYAMLDAMEKLRLAEGEEPTWDILRCSASLELAGHLDPDASLMELNALCQQLAQLDEEQLAIVEGLTKMEGTEIIPISRLIDMAYSTDCCYFLEGIVNDSQLGRFCAGNGFLPEVDGLTDQAFELLDFERIGWEFRQSEGGVFTAQGYVQRHDRLKPVSKTMCFTPKTPDYTVLALTSGGCEVKFPFPANEPMGTEPVRCVDCAAPSLIGISGGMESMDLLARRLSGMAQAGTLPKFRALTEATGCGDINWALTLADSLDEYVFDPEIRSPEDMARAMLTEMLSSREAEQLLPYLNRHQYGQALIEEDGGKLTGYGLIQRSDGGPIQTMEQKRSANGMEMTL